MKDLGIAIENINILGGEPLLHPKLEQIIVSVKKIYPNANLGILTNGLLLLDKDKFFWEICKQNSVKLNVTCFPVMTKEKRDEIQNLITKYELDFHMTNKKRFNKILVLNNNDSLQSIQEACGCNNAYNLHDGYVSRCTVPMVVHILNSHFNVKFIEEGRLNIYQSTAEEIIKYLNTPNKSCLNCSANPIKVEWEKAETNPKVSDWVIQ
jgi:wyosine [tRNA(Phe)-imidazoG37] synthetase (radical SAM superfamily)